MGILKKLTRRHAFFIVIGIGDLGLAACLLTEGSKPEGVVGLAGTITFIGLVTGLQGCVALALCPGLSSLDSDRYIRRAALLVLFGTPLWIIVVFLVMVLFA